LSASPPKSTATLGLTSVCIFTHTTTEEWQKLTRTTTRLNFSLQLLDSSSTPTLSPFETRSLSIRNNHFQEANSAIECWCFDVVCSHCIHAIHSLLPAAHTYIHTNLTHSIAEPGNDYIESSNATNAAKNHDTLRT